jgi:membrane protein DedA with SNARE-associated domain
MPEELPIVVGGALAGGDKAIWWIMLPVCIVAVIIGDSCLYFIGRWWGPRLLQYDWVRKHLLPPDRLRSIEQNFRDYGVRILLFARLTPGIRAPIFLTAGVTRLSLARFVLADGIYAIPGVSILFFLGYWFTERMVAFVEQDVERVKSVIVLVVILAIAGYLLYRFLRKPMVTGAPGEMPRLVEQVTHKLDEMTSKIMHPHKAADAAGEPNPPAAPQPDPAHAEEGRAPHA